MGDLEIPNKSKRKRAPNYTSSEREFLLNCILDFKNIIENKKTDGVSVSEKKAAWEEIAAKFNAASPNIVYREADSLKKYYEHIKEDMRKRVGDAKKELYKTGGGTAKVICTENTDDLLLSIVNSKTVFGLKNKFDCDSIVSLDNQEARQTESEANDLSGDCIEVEYQETSDVQVIDNSGVQDDTGAALQRPSGSHWKKANMKDLQTPKNKVLEANIQEVYSSTKSQKRQREVCRRRPSVIRTLTSSRLGEKYELLIDKKMELLDCYKTEHLLRKESLELDIELKKKQLTATTRTDSNVSVLDSAIFL